VRQAYLKVSRCRTRSNRKAILRQNIAYFDKLGAGEVTTRITTDTNLLQGLVSSFLC
jgi:ATP-binding cassette, subfamily B (MDR/TAP), member 1